MTPIRQVPKNAAVFVDTNIFVLADGSGDLADQCSLLLERIRRAEVRGFTSTMVVAELMHRVMVKEAREKQTFATAMAAVDHLQKYPAFVQGLSRHLTVASDLRRAGFDILPLTVKDLHTSKAFRRDHGLLANDSLIVAVMRNNRIGDLATNDRSFERITGLRVWQPATP